MRVTSFGLGCIMAIVLASSGTAVLAQEMDITIIHWNVVIREDYSLSVQEEITFSIPSGFSPPTDLVLTFPYQSSEIQFYQVQMKKPVDISALAYTVIPTALVNHSSGRNQGLNLTIDFQASGQNIQTDVTYTLYFRYLIQRQIRESDYTSFGDDLLGRGKTNNEVTFWSHDWPEGAVTETTDRAMVIFAQSGTFPKNCERADTNGSVNWDPWAEWFGTTGHGAMFKQGAMTGNYLEDHNNFGVTVYYGTDKKTWRFYAFMTVVVVILLVVSLKVFQKMRSRVEKGAAFYEEEQEV